MDSTITKPVSALRRPVKRKLKTAKAEPGLTKKRKAGLYAYLKSEPGHGSVAIKKKIRINMNKTSDESESSCSGSEESDDSEYVEVWFGRLQPCGVATTATTTNVTVEGAHINYIDTCNNLTALGERPRIIIV